VKATKSSALTIGLMLLIGFLNGSQQDTKSFISHQPMQPRRLTAPEQVLAVGLMRQWCANAHYFKKNYKAACVRLGENGEIPESCMLPLNSVGKCPLSFKDREFSSRSSIIPHENVDDVLGRLDDKTMGQYLALGKIGVSKGSDEALILRSCIGGKGGGPGLAYWGGIAFDSVWAYTQWKIASRALNKLPDVADGVAEGAKQLKDHVSKFVGEMTNEDRFRGIGNVKDIANNLYLSDKAEYDLLIGKGLKDAAFNLLAKMEDMDRYREIASDIVKARVKANTKSYVADKLLKLPKAVKDSIEKGIGGNIFSDKLQDVATGAFKHGAFGALISVGFQVGSNIISNLNGPDGGTAKIIGGVIGASSEQVWGDWLDRLLEPSGIAAVAMSGFWYGGLRYTAKTLFCMGLAAVPGW
jgi:hypothetical protein